jgi:hypothetical protein
VTTIDAEKPETKVGVILGVETHLDDLHVAVAVDHLGREAWASRPKTYRLMGSSKTLFQGFATTLACSTVGFCAYALVRRKNLLASRSAYGLDDAFDLLS